MEILIRFQKTEGVKVENSLGGSCDFENPRSSVPYILDCLESTRDNFGAINELSSVSYLGEIPEGVRKDINSVVEKYNLFAQVPLKVQHSGFEGCSYVSVPGEFPYKRIFVSDDLVSFLENASNNLPLCERFEEALDI